VSDDLEPIVKVWPSCAKCGLAYVLNRALSLSQGWLWLWRPDCKCRTNLEAVIQDEHLLTTKETP